MATLKTLEDWLDKDVGLQGDVWVGQFGEYPLPPEMQGKAVLTKSGKLDKRHEINAFIKMWGNAKDDQVYALEQVKTIGDHIRVTRLRAHAG